MTGHLPLHLERHPIGGACWHCRPTPVAGCKPFITKLWATGGWMGKVAYADYLMSDGTIECIGSDERPSRLGPRSPRILPVAGDK